MSLRWTPPMTHRLLWALSDAHDVIWDLHSMRRWQLHEWRRERTLKQRQAWIEARGQGLLRQRLRYLRAAGLLLEQVEGRGKVWQLTTKGRLQALATATYAIGRSKARHSTVKYVRGQWLVAFDIPEEFRRYRTLLRRVLYSLDGKFIQRSVFVLVDSEGQRLLRHIVDVAKLDRYVLIVEIKGKLP